MYCEEIQQLILLSRGQVHALPLSGRQHLGECESCSRFAEDVVFPQLLRRAAVPSPSEGFTDRVLQQAWLSGERNDRRDASRTGYWLAIAASLVLATSVALQSVNTGRDSGPSPTGQQTVLVTPHQVSNIDLLMVSAQDLPQATITLRMDDNVNLAGYAGDRELRWTASLVAGNNQLSLPVQLQGSASGDISVRVDSGSSSRELLLTVDPVRPQHGALLII